MHKLSNTGKRSGMSQIANFLSYTVKVVELLQSHTLTSVVIYDNGYFSTNTDFAGAAIRSISICGFLLSITQSINLSKPWLGLMPTHAPIPAANHNFSSQSATNLALCWAVISLNAACHNACDKLLSAPPSTRASSLDVQSPHITWTLYIFTPISVKQ